MSVAWFDGITVTVEISLTSPSGYYALWDYGPTGWDIGTWGPDVTWVDVSEYVISIEINRAFRADGAWSPGSGSIVLDDQDGRFSADNPSSPYVVSGVSSLCPWRPVRVMVTYAGVTYTLATMLTGTWDDSQSSPMPAYGGRATKTVEIRDEWERLSRAGAPGAASAGAGELFGPRCHRILDGAGHRGERDIEPGDVTFQATTLTTDPIRELQLTADTEGGHIWVDAAGTIVARGRRSPTEAARSHHIQATFTDQVTTTGDIHYHSFRPEPAVPDLFTSATYTRVGGSAQTYTDFTSAMTHGNLRDVRSDLLADNDGDVLSLATWKVAFNSSDLSRIAEVSFRPRAKSCVDLPTLLSLKEYDLIQFIRHKPGGYSIERYCHVFGFTHSIDVNGEWTMTVKLADATIPMSYASSGWDVGTWGSSVFDQTACKWYPV